MYHYDHKLKSNAKELRKNMTDQEKKLWYIFLRDYKVRFQRQKPVDKYIVDFYYHKAKLVVELDGSQHFDDDGLKYDEKRTQALERLGIKVMRFTNREIDREFRAVCETIDNEVNERLTPPADKVRRPHGADAPTPPGRQSPPTPSRGGQGCGG